MLLKREAQIFTVIGLTAKYADSRITGLLYPERL